MNNSHIDKPVTDLSARVISLAREIDRLPPGRYSIELEKQSLTDEPWRLRIMRMNQLLNTWIQDIQIPDSPKEE